MDSAGDKDEEDADDGRQPSNPQETLNVKHQPTGRAKGTIPCDDIMDKSENSHTDHVDPPPPPPPVRFLYMENGNFWGVRLLLVPPPPPLSLIVNIYCIYMDWYNKYQIKN